MRLAFVMNSVQMLGQLHVIVKALFAQMTRKRLVLEMKKSFDFHALFNQNTFFDLLVWRCVN